MSVNLCLSRLAALAQTLFNLEFIDMDAKVYSFIHLPLRSMPAVTR